MTKEINKSKLDTEQELKHTQKLGTLPKLKFTDYVQGMDKCCSKTFTPQHYSVQILDGESIL